MKQYLFVALALVGCTAKSTLPGLTLDYCVSYPTVPGCEQVLTEGKSILVKADEYFDAGKYKAAWAVLSLSAPHEKDQTRHYLTKRPEVYQTGKSQFSREELERVKSRSANNSAVYVNLDKFTPVSTSDDARWAEGNVREILGERGASLGVPAPKKPKQYGRIVDVQIINHSKINAGGGSILGATAGQAVYLDHTSLQGYSAAAQLGAGLVGAIVGSALDAPTEIRFERRYWIRLNSGDTVTVTDFGSDHTHIPKGVCVDASNYSIATASESNCRG